MERVGLRVTRPEEDDKYGNATLDPADVERLSVSTLSAVPVNGTVQTAPSEDGQGSNAGFLRLQAEVPRLNAPVQLAMANGFAVAAIPVAIRASRALICCGERHWAGWFWGVKYELEAKSDGGALNNVSVIETIKPVERDGIFGTGSGLIVGEWTDATQPIVDRIGRSVNVKTIADAREKLADAIVSKGGHLKGEQKYRFWTARMGGTKQVEGTPHVKKSGFLTS